MIHSAIKGMLGRKALMGLLTIAIGILIEFFAPKGLSPEMLSLLQFIAIGFFLGNGMEHVADAVKKRKPVNNDVDRLENEMQKVSKAQMILSDQIAINQKQSSMIMQHLQQSAHKDVSFE